MLRFITVMDEHFNEHGYSTSNGMFSVQVHRKYRYNCECILCPAADNTVLSDLVKPLLQTFSPSLSRRLLRNCKYES